MISGKIVLLFAGAAAVASCNGSSSTSPGPTSPTTPTVLASYVTAAVAQTATATEAVSRPAAPPASTGGPAAMPVALPNAMASGLNLVTVQASSPFQAVFISVGPISTPATQPSGYLLINLPSPALSVPIALTYAASLPSSGFDLQFQLVGASGAIGPITRLHRNVVPTTIELIGAVYATWNGTPRQEGDQPDPVAGAVVGTSLDGRTATTDANGMFDLQAGVNTSACFTFSIAAAGFPTYTAQRKLGNSTIVLYTLGSSPQFPIQTPCN